MNHEHCERNMSAIPEIENGSPIKDFIDEYDLYAVTCELAKRLDLVKG